MSEDGFPDPYDEPSMDLVIETLTGTSFEMRVYPTDTVLDIKNKIHRVEGIPVHHQNLLFQMKELQDYARLCDVGIVSGSSLKLVLSMRGGPISTRRLSTCDHHFIWKDLKDLIEHTRDEIGDKTGSKVSVLVFKEGEVINVIRVIENEDGSYSPYTDKAISPPYSRHKEKDDLQQTFFKKMSEDMEMATKMHVLKSKMKKLRQQRHPKAPPDHHGGGDGHALLLGASGTTSRRPHRLIDDFKAFEGKICVAEQPENGEIALKEKHRSRTRDKLKMFPEPARTEGKPYFCKNLHIFEPDQKKDTDDDRLINIFEEPKPESNAITTCTEMLSLAARNHIQLTQLVLQDAEHGKSSPDSIELEENSPEMWEIQPETIKSGGAYKVGLLKRRTSVDHTYDPDFSLESSGSNLEREQNGGGGGGGEYEVFGRNFYHVPQFVSAPSAIPPQYTPKDELCDLYLGSPVSDAKIRRSPLYGRRAKTNVDYNVYSDSENRLGRSLDEGKLQKLQSKSDFNSIERLQNDYVELDYEDFDVNYADDVFGYYNSSCTTELDKILNPRYKDDWSDPGAEDAQLANEIKRLSFDLKVDERPKVQIETTKLEDLPAVVGKKRMRCGQCNKRLNITNIYNCRCGRIFCSQHRYSELHDCKYDYKTEGRKLLEQQNPLVTATKLTKF